MPPLELIDDTLYIKDDSKFNRILCFIQYKLYGSTKLLIKNIERTSFGDKYINEHFGTDILNSLLIELHNTGMSFNTIEGKLSIEDARNNNWLKSIPFYNSFPQHLDNKLPYRLTVRFYQDKLHTISIDFQNDSPTFIEIKQLINKHLKLKADAFFVFQVNC